MNTSGLDLAVIGNGRTAALVNRKGRLVWWCYPRFDGDPVFSRLLSGEKEKGFCDVEIDSLVAHDSQYVRNTAIVRTELTGNDGTIVRITDFAPRYGNFGRISRPPQLVRIIEPIKGIPHITLRMRPTHSYGKPMTDHVVGSNHIRYYGGGNTIRVTTDAPLSYLENETRLLLTRKLHMVIGVDEPFPGELGSTCRELCSRTCDYWLEWVRRLSTGSDWQDAIIRAAITLKMANFEETGAVVAALTTSIPEAPNSGRNWDYRFCWLRDAYFVVKALNRIGATRTMEDFITYILGIAREADGEFKPVYGVVPTEDLSEDEASNLAGYLDNKPVRIGNAAALQAQHDAYGSIILAAMPMFFDRRLPRLADTAMYNLLEPLGKKAAELALKSDAGLWEYRGRTDIHTHSATMCWAGVNRMAAIAEHLGLSDRASHWNEAASMIQKAILENAWNSKRGAFTAAFGGNELDASILLLAELGLVDANDPRFVSTIHAVERDLRRGDLVMRYTSEDDFGTPETAFLVCRYWMIDAIWGQGRHEEARSMFAESLRYRNHYGLLSEDVDPKTGALWGNFPQTYSMAGLILTGMRLSRSWEDRYWHASS